MKSYKSIVLFLLIISLLLIQIGCLNNNARSGQNASGQDNKNGVLSGESKSLPAKLANPNIKILTWAGANNTNAMTEKEEVVKAFEEKYGGKVSYDLAPAGNDLRKKLITSITAGDFFDVVFWRYDDMPLYAVNNLVQPIDEYFDFNDSIWADKMSVIDQFRWNGKCYGVQTSQGVFVVFFNKTLFEQNGVKTPLEHYREGTWNWETYRQTAKALTLDMDGDGSIDLWGSSTYRDADFLILANDVDFITWDDKGGIELTVKQDPVIEALQFFQDGIVKDKYMPASIKIGEAFPAGKLAMVPSTSNYFQKTIVDGGMKYEWDIAPIPTPPSASRNVTPGVSTFFGIGTGSENPVGGAAYIYLDCKMERDRVDEKMLEYYTEEQVALIKGLMKEMRIPKYEGVGNMRKVLGSFWKEVKKGTPIITVVEKYIPLFEQEIDATLKGSN